jgi:CRP-like cAMP-binding protein
MGFPTFEQLYQREPWARGRAETEENRLLAGLPDEETRILDSILERVEVRSKHRLAEAGGEIDFVHFPQSAIISLITVLKEIDGVEALTVGREGMFGLPVVHGSFTSFRQSVCQVPGISRRAEARAFLDALADLPELRRRLGLYSLAAFDTMSQTAACNRLHSTEQRCARWLLLSRDRLGRDELEVTHGFLSVMLGVTRPGVTVAIGILVRGGLIEHQRGRIYIRDRRGLEAVSCECYGVIRTRDRDLFREV